MKHLYSLILTCGLSFTMISQTTYYTCATAPGTASTLATDAAGSSCGTTKATWDVANNTAIVRNGTSYFVLTASNTDVLDANLTVENGGSMGFNTSGSNKTFTIASTATFTVSGTISATSNVGIVNNGNLVVTSTGTLDNSGSANNSITISGTGTAVIEGNVIARDFIVASGATVELAAGATLQANVTLENNGSITGEGSITGNATLSGSGTINGANVSDLSLGGSTITLSAVGYTWNGTNWVSTANAANTKTTATLDNSDKIFVDGTDFDLTTGNTLASGRLEVAVGSSLSIESGAVLNISKNLNNNGTVTLTDNALVSIGSLPAGNTGSFNVIRNFTRTGWHHIGFPVTSGSLTVSSLSPTGISISTAGDNTHSIYNWNAATSTWDLSSAGTSLNSQGFTLFVSSAPSSVSVSVPSTNFNVAELSQNYTYNNPGASSTPPGNGTGWTNTTTDGWNMLINPFHSYLNWDEVDNNLGTDLEGAVYVWNGTTYLTRSGGVGSTSAQFISPHQTFFVRTSASSSTQVIAPASSTLAPGNSTNLFKTNRDINRAKLILEGEGYEVETYLAERQNATQQFDPSLDAVYFVPSSNAPNFYSAGLDSLAYAIQCVQEYSDQNIYLGFHYFEDNKTFTLSLDSSDLAYTSSLLIEDLHTNTVHDLANGSYTFSSAVSAPMERFKLLLSSASISLTENSMQQGLSGYFRNSILFINTPEGLDIKEVQIFDLSGKRVLASRYTNYGVSIDQKGVLIIKARSKNGEVFQFLLKH